MMKKRIMFAGIGAILLIGAIALTVRHFSKPILIGAILPLQSLTGNEANLFIRYYQDQHP